MNDVPFLPGKAAYVGLTLLLFVLCRDDRFCYFWKTVTLCGYPGAAQRIDTNVWLTLCGRKFTLAEVTLFL